MHRHLGTPILFALALGAGCTRDPLANMGRATILGRFAAEGGDANDHRNARVIDSEETSLDGLRVDLEAWTAPLNVPAEAFEESLAFDRLLGSEIPDADGRFLFEDVPGVALDRLHPSWGGYFFVRIDQPPGASVTYGEGAQIKFVWEGDRMPLSLPLATRFELPMWFVRPETASPTLGMHVAAYRDRVVTLHPTEGVGLLDPMGATISVLRMPAALAFSLHPDRLTVLEDAGVAVIALLHETPFMGGDDVRFVLVDLAALDDAPAGSDLVDEDLFVVVDVAGTTAPAHDPWPGMTELGFPPRATLTADGARYYEARLGSTWAIDLADGTLVDAWHDNGVLGAYQPQTDELFFDLGGGALRIRRGATGADVADVDLGASDLLGAVGLPDGRTLVSYASQDSPPQHRIAILGEGGVIESDGFGGDVLGFTDRFWHPDYDWGTCSSFFMRSPDCPGCPEGPADHFGPIGGELRRLELHFDVARSYLIVPDKGGQRYRYADGLFHPMPSATCTRFALTSLAQECDGEATYDAGSGVVVLNRRGEGVCVFYPDGDDLSVPLRIPQPPEVPTGPAVLSELGSAFIAGEDALIGIHYRNPDAARLPAVRDLREALGAP